MSFAGIRFVLAFLILSIIIATRGVRLPRERRDYALIAVTGVLSFALNYGLLFWGEQHVSSGLAAVLQATIPAFGLALAHLHLPGERLTWAKAAGVVLGIAGVAVIFSNQLALAGRMAVWGGAAIVAGAACAAYSNVLVKARGREIEPAVLAAGQMACGMAPLMLAGTLFEGSPLKFRWTWLAVGSLLYLTVVGSVVAFMLYYWLVRHMDVTKTMLISLVTPFVAVLLGMAALGEELTWRALAGAALIVSGIALAVFERKIKKEEGGREPA